MRWLLPIIACAGCKWVYDAQYDDRADALEKFRTQFLPGTAQVKFITGSDKKFFWVDLVEPLEQPMLHSFDPATGAKIDYAPTSGDTNIMESYTVSDALYVRCSFGTSTAFDATQPNTQIATTDQGEDHCAIDGGDVYFDVNRKIVKWTPSTGQVAQVADLDAQSQPVGTDEIGGMGVTGHQLLLEEGGRLWLIDFGTGVATWLQNPPVTSGQIAFDATGVVFNTQQGVMRELFADHSTQLLSTLIADGGYEINFEHADAQELDDNPEYALSGSYIVYRGKHGIFAYGLQSTKVIDLLLDRGGGADDLEAKPIYHTPVVSGGALFVQDTSDFGSDEPVYEVTLTGRLP